MTKNGRIALTALIAGIVLCLAVRTVGILSFTDMKTGFLLSESAPAYCIVFYGVCAAASVVSALFAPKLLPDDISFSKGKIHLMGWIMVFIAAFAAWDGFQSLHTEAPSILRVCSDFAAAVFIEIVALITIVKKKFTPALGLMYAIVGAYFVLCGMAYVSQRMVILSVQEYLIEVLCATIGGVFFALFGKICSGNAEKHTVFFMRLWGSGAAIMTISSSLSVIIAKIFGGEEISSRITADIPEAVRFFQENALSPDGNYMMTFVPPVLTIMGVFAAFASALTYFEKKK